MLSGTGRLRSCSGHHAPALHAGPGLRHGPVPGEYGGADGHTGRGSTTGRASDPAAGVRKAGPESVPGPQTSHAAPWLEPAGEQHT